MNDIVTHSHQVLCFRPVVAQGVLVLHCMGLHQQLPLLVHCSLHFLPTLQHPVQAHLGAHHLVDQVADQDHRIWVKHLYKLVVKTNTFIFCHHSCV